MSKPLELQTRWERVKWGFEVVCLVLLMAFSYLVAMVIVFGFEVVDRPVKLYKKVLHSYV